MSLVKEIWEKRIKKFFQYLLSLFIIFVGISGVIEVSYNSYLLIAGQKWEPYSAKIVSFKIKQIKKQGGSSYCPRVIYKNKKIRGDTFSTSLSCSLTIKERKEFP